MIFKDGDKTVLKGCPECGWNKFLYVKDLSPIVERVEEKKEDKIEIRDIDELVSHPRIESVRILGPGSYEINLESLLDREEIIMALKEDGSYVIHFPSLFGEKKKKGRKR